MAKVPIPPPQIPLVARDGKMEKPWYDYFLDVDRFVSGRVALKAYAVASLPAPISGVGLMAFVNNATATTQNSVVAGGGSFKVIVFSDGVNWRIA